MVDYHREFSKAESSVIREAQFHPERDVLEIRIEQPNGDERVYFYEEVPEVIYIDLLSASSKGRYYNSRIKGEFDTFGRGEE